MSNQLFAPRKRRTRGHQIADQSINHVERCIIDEGHTVQRTEKDYGYDLMMVTYDEEGYVEPGMVWFQLKATELLKAAGADYLFDLDIRDYNLWMLEKMPVILILYDAFRRRAYWTDVRNYFREHPERRPKQGAKTVRVRIPIRQRLTRRAIAKIRESKWRASLRVAGEQQ